jgi:hypothetical protein
LQFGHLDDTGRTPGSPVVDHQPFAPVLIQIVLAAIHRNERHIDGLHSEWQDKQQQQD